MLHSLLHEYLGSLLFSLLWYILSAEGALVHSAAANPGCV